MHHFVWSAFALTIAIVSAAAESDTSSNFSNHYQRPNSRWPQRSNAFDNLRFTVSTQPNGTSKPFFSWRTTANNISPEQNSTHTNPFCSWLDNPPQEGEDAFRQHINKTISLSCISERRVMDHVQDVDSTTAIEKIRTYLVSNPFNTLVLFEYEGILEPTGIELKPCSPELFKLWLELREAKRGHVYCIATDSNFIDGLNHNTPEIQDHQNPEAVHINLEKYTDIGFRAQSSSAATCPIGSNILGIMRNLALSHKTPLSRIVFLGKNRQTAFNVSYACSGLQHHPAYKELQWQCFATKRGPTEKVFEIPKEKTADEIKKALGNKAQTTLVLIDYSCTSFPQTHELWDQLHQQGYFVYGIQTTFHRNLNTAESKDFSTIKPDLRYYQGAGFYIQSSAQKQCKIGNYIFDIISYVDPEKKQFSKIVFLGLQKEAAVDLSYACSKLQTWHEEMDWLCLHFPEAPNVSPPPEYHHSRKIVKNTQSFNIAQAIIHEQTKEPVPSSITQQQEEK